MNSDEITFGYCCPVCGQRIHGDLLRDHACAGVETAPSEPVEILVPINFNNPDYPLDTIIILLRKILEQLERLERQNRYTK